mmetsp:Transcript_149856/g.481433  ORF Transcript_149856/g.481433 Transcript_149856/m.481433 type:complete len:357 (-) Transcript_149856:537-1607(-)
MARADIKSIEYNIFCGIGLGVGDGLDSTYSLGILLDCCSCTEQDHSTRRREERRGPHHGQRRHGRRRRRRTRPLRNLGKAGEADGVPLEAAEGPQRHDLLQSCAQDVPIEGRTQKDNCCTLTFAVAVVCSCANRRSGQGEEMVSVVEAHGQGLKLIWRPRSSRQATCWPRIDLQQAWAKHRPDEFRVRGSISHAKGIQARESVFQHSCSPRMLFSEELRGVHELRATLPLQNHLGGPSPRVRHLVDAQEADSIHHPLLALQSLHYDEVFVGATLHVHASQLPFKGGSYLRLAPAEADAIPARRIPRLHDNSLRSPLLLRTAANVATSALHGLGQKAHRLLGTRRKALGGRREAGAT